MADNREHVGVAACPGPAVVRPRVVQRLHEVDNLAVNPGRDAGSLIESRTSQLSHGKRRGAPVVFSLDGDVVAARLERAFRARRLRIAERSIVGNAHAVENGLGSCLADRHDLRTVRHLAFREEIVRRQRAGDRTVALTAPNYLNGRVNEGSCGKLRLGDLSAIERCARRFKRVLVGIGARQGKLERHGLVRSSVDVAIGIRTRGRHDRDVVIAALPREADSAVKDTCARSAVVDLRDGDIGEVKVA